MEKRRGESGNNKCKCFEGERESGNVRTALPHMIDKVSSQQTERRDLHKNYSRTNFHLIMKLNGKLSDNRLALCSHTFVRGGVEDDSFSLAVWGKLPSLFGLWEIRHVWRDRVGKLLKQKFHQTFSEGGSITKLTRCAPKALIFLMIVRYFSTRLIIPFCFSHN